MPENASSIWLVAREYEGWASAGGVKDVVHDMARALTELGWQVHVCLPLYGFLKDRVFQEGQRSWTGRSQHPVFRHEGECWTVSSGNLHLHFFRFSSVEHKQGIYTVTLAEQNPALKLVHGNGYPDT
ncbi:MAG: glycogen/starch synthase, partial [Spirochaetales bacterium]|nr:glycogen/starch synthase [Spirochaetales bacterium]